MNTIPETYTLHGYAALRIARRDGVTLYFNGSKVLNPRSLPDGDSKLVTAKVQPCGWYLDDAHYTDEDLDRLEVSSFFHDGRYLGPDENGIEPRWRDAGV